MQQSATLHLLPTAATTGRVFEVRRLAVIHGCQFIPSRKSPHAKRAAPPTPPTGGHAA